MRTLLWALLDTEKANQSLADGTMPSILQGAIENLRPEATYFTSAEGKRACFLVFDMADPSQLPTITEPFFRLGAKVTVQPVMNLDDLQKGLSQLGR